MAAASGEVMNRIKVVLRVRPPDKREQEWFRRGENKPILRDALRTPNPDTRVIVDRTSKTYDFDWVFREDSTQRMLFKTTALPTLENVFAGYCGAVMAYGQTGTGKTHTMQGYPNRLGAEEKGIIPRCAEYIFNRIEKTPGITFTVSVNFVQIYLDKLQDLFQPDAPEVTINPETERVELPGITEHTVTNADHFMKLFYYGEKHRVTRATNMNETSSRGHAALVVHLRMEPQDEEGLLSTKVGKLVLVDLAGYERFTLTGATGIAAEEAKKINASLLALGSVVNALADACSTNRVGTYHIPYRNAKLTRLLKDCLGGTSKSTIICTVGPCDRYSQETSGTLYFGWRAMAVKVNATIKEVYDPAKYTQHLKNKLVEATDRIKTLVQAFRKASPSGWDAYVRQYGEPDVHIDFTEDDEEAAIMAAMSRDAQAQAKAQARDDFAQGGRGPRRGLAPEEVLDDAALEVDPNAPAEVKQVQRDFNMALLRQKEQAERELDVLRLRHLQDIEEARAAGVSEEVLARLRQEHEDELSMVREQNVLLKEEILRQKQKEEAKALLQSAKAANVQFGTASPGARVTDVQRMDDARINEICTHLQETCNNKDEVLVRMFDLICYYEAQIKDHDVNTLAILSTHANEVAAREKEALQDARAREERLLRDLHEKDSEIQRLRSGHADVESVGRQSSATLVRQASGTALTANRQPGLHRPPSFSGGVAAIPTNPPRGAGPSPLQRTASAGASRMAAAGLPVTQSVVYGAPRGIPTHTVPAFPGNASPHGHR